MMWLKMIQSLFHPESGSVCFAEGKEQLWLISVM
jgi:hypothetical protein